MKIITRKDWAKEIGLSDPNLRCDECTAQELGAVAEFICEGIPHFVCLRCLGVAKSQLADALKTCDKPSAEGS